MIIFLAGETGSGKTDTGWALIGALGAVLLDCDWFASRSPFSWDRGADVESVYQAILNQVAFHLGQGRTDFVVTLTPEMAVAFESCRPGFEECGLPIQAFRLAAEPHIVQQRIRARDRDQKSVELANAARHRALLDELFGDNSVFAMIDNAGMDPRTTADAIIRRAKNENSK
jgi:hypothetical protein